MFYTMDQVWKQIENIYFHYRFWGRENKTLFILPLQKEGTSIILLAKGTN